MRSACLILLVMALAPLRGAAQPVVGIVVEEGTGAPIHGAMVILFDSTGAQVAKTLSNVAGRFLVRAAHPGLHYIRVERIGYADWTTDRFNSQPGSEPLTIRVPVRVVRLQGLVVSAGRRCEVRPEEGNATARVWEEVRKALAADAFLDTHCFGLREGEDGEEDMIGLVFRPVEGREVPEIGGVLWLDAETSELERLEFAYLNLGRSREIGEPGGRSPSPGCRTVPGSFATGASGCLNSDGLAGDPCVARATSRMAGSYGRSRIRRAGRSCTRKPRASRGW